MSSTRFTLLCYGDSNTWGFDPASGGRFPAHRRWTGVLREELSDELGERYHVVEEGLCGRTTVWDDPIEGMTPSEKNGKTYLGPCLASHAPLGAVILMLGTNDLKARFSLPASDIANGAGALVDLILRNGVGPDGVAPRVLLVAPPPLASLTGLAEMFTGAAEKAKRFAAEYARVAEERACDFLNAGEVIASSPLDGLHFEASEHWKLGRAVAAWARGRFEGGMQG